MDIRKLQRAIVDGLEDVKAQDITVFNTEHLSPLFERVIIASGTSNRQTKALAASVRDAVRANGFPMMRTEGEDNGEWIIVDCGAAVAHIMQPDIRRYYHLEEIWGGKLVKMKFGEVKQGLVKAAPVADEAPAPGSRSAAKKKPAGKPAAAKKAPSRRPTVQASPGRRSPAAKSATSTKSTNSANSANSAKSAKSAVGSRDRSGSSAGSSTAKPATRAPMKTVVVQAPTRKSVVARPAAKKAAAKVAPARKAVAAKKGTRRA